MPSTNNNNNAGSSKDPLLAHSRTAGTRMGEQDEKIEGQQPVGSPGQGAPPSAASPPTPWAFRLSRVTSYLSMPRPFGLLIALLLAYITYTSANLLLKAPFRPQSSEAIVHTAASPSPPIEDTEPVARVISWEDIPPFSLERNIDVHVTIKYQSCGNHYPGLINQHIAHEQALMLAAALRADKVLWPPSRQRSTFNSRTEHVEWSTVDSSVIYDMEHIKSFAKKKYGVEVVAVPSANYDHSYTRPRNTRAGGYVALLGPSGDGEVPGTQVVLSKKIRKGFNNLQNLAEHVNQRIDKLIRRHGQDLKHTPQVVVVLDTPFYMLSYAPEDIAVPITSNLLFAKNLRRLAERAIGTALKRTGATTFNGLHLRVEEDATSFLNRVGGECGMRVLHNRAMEAAGFNEREPVIVASGVFSMSSMSPSNLQKAITYSSDILGDKHASKVLTKEMLLKPSLLEPLGGEEKAVVDWLILKESRLAVGWAASTFSISIREARMMEGKEPNSMRLVTFQWDRSSEQVPEQCRQQTSNQPKQRKKKQRKSKKEQV